MSIQTNLDCVFNNLNQMKKIIDEIEKEETKPKKVNQYEEYKKLKRLSYSKKLDKVSEISKIIDFFEEISVINDLYSSERRQIFYFLNKLENKDFRKLSDKVEQFKEQLDTIYKVSESLKKIINFNSDKMDKNGNEEFSPYELEVVIHNYILSILLPKYGFKGIKEDF